MFGHLLKRGAAMLCLAAVLALPVCAEGRITTDMTMKEIRSDPAIAGSGVSTYCKGDAVFCFPKIESIMNIQCRICGL